MSYEENPDNMTPREAADALSAERWDDERRERYAAAIWNEGFETTIEERNAFAHAAMAVADAELAVEKEKYLHFREVRMRQAAELENENARLRAELDELAREISRLRAELEDYEGGAEHDNDLVEELRLDLREAQESGSHNFKVAMDQWDKIRQVRIYALSRCTEEFGDYASASVVLGILDGEINIEEENEPL